MNEKQVGLLITPQSAKKFIIYFVLVVLLLVPSILFVITQRDIKKLQKEIDEVKHANNELGITMNDYKDVVGVFYEEYQDTGMLTVDILEESVRRMDSAIEVYDNNVEIYNAQLETLDARTTKLEDSVEIIAKYLSQ